MPADRNIKDSMFRLAYTKPGYAESIITEVTGGRLRPSFDEIQDVRIERQLTAGMGNDLAFTVNGEVLLLVEAQRYTIKNIALRMLFYVADILKDKYWKNSSMAVTHLPTIHLYVIYSGDESKTAKTLSLSDMMVPPIAGLPIDLNVTVHVLKEEDAHVPEVRQYFQFCRIVDLCRNGIQAIDGHSFRQKFRAELLHYCRAYGIFTDIVDEYANEFEEVVYAMSEIEFIKKYEREEGREEGRAEGREEGREEGRAEGRAEGREEGRAEGIAEGRETGILQAARDAYTSLIAQKVPLDIIRRTVSSMGVSEEELEVIEGEYSGKAKGSAPSNSISKITLE